MHLGVKPFLSATHTQSRETTTETNNGMILVPGNTHMTLAKIQGIVCIQPEPHHRVRLRGLTHARRTRFFFCYFSLSRLESLTHGIKRQRCYDISSYRNNNALLMTILELRVSGSKGQQTHTTTPTLAPDTSNTPTRRDRACFTRATATLAAPFMHNSSRNVRSTGSVSPGHR